MAEHADGRGRPRTPEITELSIIDNRSATDRLAHLTNQAWRGFVRSLTPRLAAHGVSFSHWTFLRILWTRDGITQRELSDEADVTEPSTFAALRSMEALGYVSRAQVPGNRKNMYVHLTPRGRALRAVLEPLAEEVNRLAVRGVSAEDHDATRRTLVAIIESTGRDVGLRRTSPAKRAPAKAPASRRSRR